MAFRALVNRQIAGALRTIGDLAEVVTITHQGEGAFDFATGSRGAGVVTTLSNISAVREVIERVNDNQEIEPVTVLRVQTTGLVGTTGARIELNQYTIVTFADNTIWEVVRWTDDGFLTTIEIRRRTS